MTQVLLLDELTTFLDGDDQENVLDCVRGIVDASRGGQGAQGLAAETPEGPGCSGGGGGASSSSSTDGGDSGGVTALWVTHRLEELRWADGVSYMDQGRVVFTGTPDEARAYLRRLGAHV